AVEPFAPYSIVMQLSERSIVCCLYWGIWIAFACGVSGQIHDSSQATDAAPQIPQPAGPFGIGRVGYHWVDEFRPDRFSTSPAVHRELMVYFWYPTSPKSPIAKGPYLPGAQRMDSLAEPQAKMRGEFGSRWPAMVSGAIFSHVVENAP